MSDQWQCPKCKRSHESRYTFGAIQARAPEGLVLREVHHADVVCFCGKRTSGKEIAAGLHDRSDLPSLRWPPPSLGASSPDCFLGEWPTSGRDS